MKKNNKTDYRQLALNLVEAAMDHTDAVRRNVSSVLMDEIDRLNGEYKISIFVPTNGTNVEVTQNQYDDIMQELLDKKKIPAIKLLRAFSGLGLVEAKKTIEYDSNFIHPIN